MNDDTALQTFGMSKKDFGKALIENSQNEMKKQAIGKITHLVSHYQRAITVQQTNINTASRLKRLYEQRLAAIGSGEFECDAEGNITYDAMDLNDPSVT